MGASDQGPAAERLLRKRDRKSTRLNSSHSQISYAVFCLKKKTTNSLYFFFFNDTATTEIYTLSLHDALPISSTRTNRKLFTSFPSRATASITCMKESCVCIAAAPVETNGSL